MTAPATLSGRRIPITERVVGDLLLERGERLGDQAFVSVGDAPALTFGELADRSRRAAGGLKRLGVTKGTPVGLMLPNCEEYLVAWLGLALLGAVEVPVNTALKGSLLAHVLADSGCELVIVHAALLEEVKRVVADIRLVAVGGAPGETVISWIEVEAAAAADPVALGPSDPIAVMYTSGTTGPAKGVTCPHGYFVCWADDTSAAVRLGDGDVLYTPLPLYHITAQAVNVLAALVVECRVHVDTRFSPTGFWERMARIGATHVWSFGSMTPLLFRAPEDASDHAHRVRVVWSIPWPSGYGHEFERRFGLKLMNGYGSTEQGLTIVQPYDGVRPDTIGRASTHYDVDVVDDAGATVAVGEPGEIVCRPHEPASMMLGYHGRPDDTLAAIRDLWYHTGDRGIREADGFIRFVDRKTDAIRRRGENISAWEVESVVARHGAVEECAAVAVPSDLGEDDLKLVVVASDTVTARELFDYCSAELPYYMVPRYVEIVAELPKTPSLRIQKYMLREQGVTDGTWDCEQSGLRIRRPEVRA